MSRFARTPLRSYISNEDNLISVIFNSWNAAPRRADFTWKWFSNQKFCSRSDNMRVCMYIHIYIYYYWIAIRYFLPLFFSIVSFWFYYCFLFFFLRWNIVSYSILYYVYRNTWRLIMNVGMKFLKNWIYIYIYFLWKKP